MALIQLDTSTEQLKQYRSLLHTTALCGTATGLFVWSITPFLTSNKIARYGSLVFSLGTGISTLYCGIKLEQNKALYEAIKKAEKSDFLTRLAASEYHQQQRWEMLSQDFSEPLPPLPDFSAVENSENQTETESYPIVENGKDFSDQLDVEKIGKAVKEGKPDSFIITEILGMKGRKYSEGKQLLDEIKLIVNHQQN